MDLGFVGSSDISVEIVSVLQMTYLQCVVACRYMLCVAIFQYMSRFNKDTVVCIYILLRIYLNFFTRFIPLLYYNI